MKTSIQKWAMHGVGSAMSLLVLVSNIPPHLQLLGVHTGQIVGTAGLLIALWHGLTQVWSEPAPESAQKQAGFTRVSMLVLIGASGLLAGCALLANPTFDLVLQAAIQATVDALLAKSPGAAAVLAQDATTLAGISSGTTTVGSLETQADTVISSSSLSIGDKAAIEDLVAAAAALLQQEASQIPTNAQSGLQLVFTDIANAAQLYASAAASPKLQGVVILK